MVINFLITLALSLSFSSKAELDNKNKVMKLYGEIREKFNDASEIKLSDVDKHIKSENIIFVDVREKSERDVSIIPGAISKEEFEKNIKSYEGKKIAAYCTIGYRSGKYVEKLKRKGIKASNLEGSILGWVHDGRPVLNPSTGKKTNKVHVYGDKWNLLPKGFKGAQ